MSTGLTVALLVGFLTGLSPAAGPTAPRRTGPTAGLGLGLRHEPGVETRLPLALSGEYSPLASLRVAGAFSADLSRSPLPDRLGLEAGWSPVSGLELAAGAVLRRWPAWRVGENLAFICARAAPLPGLSLEAGYARRVPLLDSLEWRSPFVWSGPVAEWHLVYGLGWQAVRRPGFGLRFILGNREPLAVRTPELVSLRVEAERRLAPGWTGTAGLAGEMKGLSSVLASFGAVELGIGVRREF